jgi:ribonucleoside-diphosphate reductase subunit M2
MWDSGGTLEDRMAGFELRGEPSSSKSDKGSEKGKVVKRFPEEEDEELLRESDDRFVLFPIRYREVYPFRLTCISQLTGVDMASL